MSPSSEDSTEPISMPCTAAWLTMVEVKQPANGMQEELHRVGGTVVTRADHRLVTINNEYFRARVVFVTVGVEALDAAAVQAAVDPPVIQPKLEFGVFGVLLDGSDHVHQLFDAHTVNRRILGLSPCFGRS